jgi:hypothetical protein
MFVSEIKNLNKMKNLIIIAAIAFSASTAAAQSAHSENMKEKNQMMRDEQIRRHNLATLEISNDFQAYIQGAKEEVAGNDKRLASLKAKMASQFSKGDKDSEKAARKLGKNIIILEKYNEELKSDMQTYIKYGKGDWKLFKKEFNKYLAEIGEELNDMRHEYTEFIAENRK